jgi:hypothetical protein
MRPSAEELLKLPQFTTYCTTPTTSSLGKTAVSTRNADRAVAERTSAKSSVTMDNCGLKQAPDSAYTNYIPIYIISTS